MSQPGPVTSAPPVCQDPPTDETDQREDDAKKRESCDLDTQDKWSSTSRSEICAVELTPAEHDAPDPSTDGTTGDDPAQWPVPPVLRDGRVCGSMLVGPDATSGQWP